MDAGAVGGTRASPGLHLSPPAPAPLGKPPSRRAPLSTANPATNGNSFVAQGLALTPSLRDNLQKNSGRISIQLQLVAQESCPGPLFDNLQENSGR